MSTFTTCATDEKCPRCGAPCLFVSYDGDEGIGGDGLSCSIGSCDWYEGCDEVDDDIGPDAMAPERMAEIVDPAMWVPARTLDIEEAIVLMMARYPGAQVRIEQGEDGDWGASLWEDRDDGEGTMRELGSAESESITSALSILADGMDGDPL